jgi:glycosyltransferase involved in cell wall biosynthesis
MRIAFLDSPERDYTVRTVQEKPLGGTQTAVTHITRGLAHLGHEVLLFSGKKTNGKIDRIDHLASSTCSLQQLQSLSLDAIVLISSTGEGRRIRSILGNHQRLILWPHTPDDQPNYAPLRDPAERDAFHGFAFVSQWQADHFQKAFAIDPSKSAILRNAAGPEFHTLFAANEPMIPAKSNPPILVYTSAPDRGLSILLQAFPTIRQRIPGARLQVFSSLQLYAASADEDHQKFGQLYQQCRATEGVEYIGAVPQRELAARLREASVFAYPCATEETSCIAAMEAMSAGCFVVTTAGGGLPETTAGFASLIPAGLLLPDYLQLFVEATVEHLSMDHQSAETFLQGQRQYAAEHYDWTARPRDWEEWLKAVCG